MQTPTTGPAGALSGLPAMTGRLFPVSTRIFVPTGLRRPLTRKDLKHERTIIARAAAAAGGGDGNIGNNGSSGGGGGGGDGSDGAPGDDSSKVGGGFMAGWKARTLADPEFGFKVAVEQVIGVGAAVTGDMLSRPNFGLNELDFVFSTLIVGSLMNFSLMYLLAPTAGVPPSTSLFNRFITGELLASFKAPTGHMFEAGAYTLGSRMFTVLYKAVQFGFIGFAAGLAGTYMSSGLISLRKALDPSFTTQNELPPTVPNAACWALHMSVSSNLRYQTLNGLDMVVSPLMSAGIFRTYSTAIRLANNVVGGLSFATIARVTGVQKSSAPPAEAPAELAKKK